jgi:NADPH-dependent 2,4-dienoyl-CoA reductase/sulfur reductase-like enzyme
VSRNAIEVRIAAILVKLPTMTSQNKHIAIVGAGPAGLMAAYTLTR